MITILSTVFVASVAGSLHCIGMCGPFALMCAARKDATVKTALGSVAALNGGKLLVYAVAGFVSGGIGLMVDTGGSLAGIQRAAAWVAGGFMIAAGLFRLMPWKRVSWFRFPQVSLAQPIRRGLQWAKGLPASARAAVIGALTSLMPCGWLYVFVFAAAGTGHPLAGGLVMVTFWLGTLPALGGLMLGAAPLGPRVVARIPTVMAVVMIGLGLYTVLGRGSMELRAESLPVRDPQAALAAVGEVDPHALPCCCQSTAE